MNSLYNSDCLLLDLPKVDLIVTDPPYLIQYQSNHRKASPKFSYIQNDNNLNFISNYFALCHDILKYNSSIYIFSGWQNIDLFKQEFEKHFKLKNILIWVKNNTGMGDLRGSYAPKYEMILYGHKGRDLLRGYRYPDVLHYDRISGNKLLHPTEKPIDLLKLFISNSSDEDDIVFDGCAGTGSTLLAAKELNRNYIGVEIDTHYYNIAKERLNGTNNLD